MLFIAKKLDLRWADARLDFVRHQSTLPDLQIGGEERSFNIIWDVKLKEVDMLGVSRLMYIVWSAPYKQPIRGHYCGVSTQTNTGLMPRIKFKLGGSRLTINRLITISACIRYKSNGGRTIRTEDWSNIGLASQPATGRLLAVVLWNMMTLTSRD